MDPIVTAFGTALVGAIATDAWEQVRNAFIGFWHRAFPQQKTDVIKTELDELRGQVLQARLNSDANIEKALEGVWQLKLQQLLRAEPALAVELRSILDEVLTPTLTPVERTRIGTIIMTGSSHDSSTFTQIGTQANYDRP